MFCRKCLKTGKKVNMIVDLEKKQYQCPECEYEIPWDNEAREE
jgi:hypothetical protein